jgi:glycosyltransferase involved in cell wall biosynthesis/preprotein translocase subunit SecG
VPGEGTVPIEQIGRLWPNGCIAANFAADPGSIIEVDHIIGCNMSFRRDVLAEIGGLRDDYPGTEVGEDTDISIRVTKLGYRIVFNPRAVLLHVGAPQAKGKRFNARYEYYHRRNNFVMLLRNYGIGLKVVRYFLATSLMAFKSMARTIGGALVRICANFAGAFVGTIVGLGYLLREHRDPIRRDEQGRAMAEALRAGRTRAGGVVSDVSARPALNGPVKPPVPSRKIVLISNTRETFTPTHSGAIASGIWEMCQIAAKLGEKPLVIAVNDPEHAPYDWPNKILINYPEIPTNQYARFFYRAQRKLNRWGHLRQKTFAMRVGDAVERSGSGAATLVLNNDPEMAVYFHRRFPHATICHQFHNQQECRSPHRENFAQLARAGTIRVSAVSAFTARWIENYFALAAMSVTPIINGVNGDTFAPAPTPPPGVPIVNFCGRTGIEKAPDLLLKAALRVAEKTNQFGVQILGANHWGHRSMDEYQSELDALTAQLESKGVSVYRPGHVSRAELPAALRKAHIHVTPSRWAEPCGLTTLEGLATGLAVVASRTGGTPEIVGDAGILFAADNVDELAGHLTRLIEDPVLRSELGRAARERSRQFTWERTWSLMKQARPVNVENVAREEPVPAPQTVAP